MSLIQQRKKLTNFKTESDKRERFTSDLVCNCVAWNEREYAWKQKPIRTQNNNKIFKCQIRFGCWSLFDRKLLFRVYWSLAHSISVSKFDVFTPMKISCNKQNVWQFKRLQLCSCICFTTGNLYILNLIFSRIHLAESDSYLCFKSK